MAEPRGGVIDTTAQPAPSEVLAALPVAVLLIGPDDRVRNANAAAETLFNRSQTAMTGRPLADIVPIPGDLADRGALGRDRGLWAYDVDLTMPHGRFRVDLVEAPIADQPGWRLLTVHNLSSPHRTGHGAEPSGGALAAVGAAAILAHEIKNPLSGIRGAAQLIAQAGGELDADARALTSLITREVDRIAALIDGMQRFGDARPLPLEAANIYPMLEHARDLAKAGFAAHVRIKEEYDPSLPEVAVHRDSFVQVMLNLLKNASEAVESVSDPRISITAAYRHGMAISPGGGRPRRSLPIEIAVADNGPGAPPEIAEHLFDPFVSGSGKGQGLGLTLVEKLVRDMGGIVQYAREGTPEHTVFRIRLARGE
ncbi:two-component sensor histidine kinase [Sphingomonas gilva]|uniref:histidine kinase n=1 Tax=Sphingomonas gilva TaxID=2305907 RepID=A0A396RJY9_9SPHN|nr:ATP-binding protein [Sphingomonas gilva]RHW16518.1 two-component sensor histidine kinase [Sphingomonas gilva]